MKLLLNFDKKKKVSSWVAPHYRDIYQLPPLPSALKSIDYQMLGKDIVHCRLTSILFSCSGTRFSLGRPSSSGFSPSGPCTEIILYLWLFDNFLDLLKRSSQLLPFQILPFSARQVFLFVKSLL